MFYLCIFNLCFNRFSYISQMSDNGAFRNGIQQINNLKNYGSVICCFMWSCFHGNVHRKIQNLVKSYTKNHCIALSEVYYPLKKVRKHFYHQTVLPNNVLSHKILRQAKRFFSLLELPLYLINSFWLRYPKQ